MEAPVLGTRLSSQNSNMRAFVTFYLLCTMCHTVDCYRQNGHKIGVWVVAGATGRSDPREVEGGW